VAKINMIDAILRRLPPACAATLDYFLFPSLREPYGGALNGQRVRQETVLELLRALPFRAVVETGTFRGSTTEFFATYASVPVYSVELSPRYFYYSKLRLRENKRVHLVLADSRDFLRKLARDPYFPKQLVFFYLDAHWYDEPPLRKEVELIFSNFRESVAMIDDFKVPGDPGYAFDDYGPGKRLCLDYLPPLSSLGLTAFFPTTPSHEETGLRRGFVVLADVAAAARLLSVRFLRAHENESNKFGRPPL